MAKRYIIKETARAEVTETFGELASLSVYALVCPRRELYAPIGDGQYAGPAIPLFSDQVQEAR